MKPGQVHLTDAMESLERAATASPETPAKVADAQ